MPDAPLALYTLELPTLKQLAKSLRTRMKARGLGMRGTAEQTGLSAATICRAAQGKEITASHYRTLVRWLAD